MGYSEIQISEKSHTSPSVPRAPFLRFQGSEFLGAVFQGLSAESAEEALQPAHIVCLEDSEEPHLAAVLDQKDWISAHHSEPNTEVSCPK